MINLTKDSESIPVAIWTLGYSSRRYGTLDSDCPYVVDTAESKSWLNGWYDADNDLYYAAHEDIY